MEAVQRVRELIELMAENDLAELEVEEPDLRVKIRKNPPVQYLPPGVNFAQLAQPAANNAAPQIQAPAAPDDTASQKANSLLEITSPMVGTFYRSTGPGGEPYIGIGSEVEPDTVVCIIEAMKVMNEIKAEVEGTIVEILIQDTEPVEFGQVLFLVEPSEA